MSSLGLATVTGAGFGLASTVLDDASLWLPRLVLVIALGVSPLLAGWLSPELKHVLLFLISVVGSTSFAWTVGGPLGLDTSFVGYVITLGVIYGGGASLVFSVGWIARQYIGWLRGHSMIVSQVSDESEALNVLRPGDRESVSRVTIGSLVAACCSVTPERALHCCASRLSGRTPCSVLVPRSHRVDRSRCGERHHLERPPQGSLELAWIRAVPALPGGIGCSAGLPGHGPFVWTSGAGPSNACSLEYFQTEPPSDALAGCRRMNCRRVVDLDSVEVR